MSAERKFTFEQIVTSMTALGIPRDRAERQARHECGVPEPEQDGAVATVAGEPEFPIRLTLPWSALCSDNRKYGAAVMRNGATVYPKLVLTPEYRAAKKKVRDIGRDAMHGFGPLAGPLALCARVYLPDERIHDACNFSKCAHDALEGVVYTKDHQLHSVQWKRAGVDCDAPRAEIEISPWDVR